MSWFSFVVSRTTARPTRRRAAGLAALTVLSLGLAACDDPQPWEQNRTPQEQSSASAPVTPPPADAPDAGGVTEPDAAGTTQPVSPPAGDDPAANGPGSSQPTSPGEDAVVPAPTSPDQADGAAAERIKNVARDQRAMWSTRTLVAAIEGCRAGRTSYLDCDTAGELGGGDRVSKAIGTTPGKLQITASPKGFRVTSFSRSGAKFTIARGPSGDRFRCTAGEQPGACTEARTWTW